MILPDTSAWIEYLRSTESAADRALTRAIQEGEQIVTNEVVMMELLAGTGDDLEAQRLVRMLAEFRLLRLVSTRDYRKAAELYRTCRRAGETIRKMNDCLIAAAAITSGAQVLHQDRDFDAIARHSDLQIYAV